MIKSANYSAAIQTAREAVEEAEGSDLKDTDCLVESLRDLAEAYQENDDRAKSIQVYEKCLQLRESRYGSDDVRSEPLILRLLTLYDEKSSGNRKRELLEQLLKIRNLVLPEYSSDVLGPLFELSQLQLKQRRFDDAATSLVLIGDVKKRVQRESDTAAYFYLQAGICKRNCNKLSDAERLFNEALELYLKRNRSPEITACYYFLAVSASDAGKTDAAVQNFEKCLSESERLGPTILCAETVILRFAGIAFTRAGKFAEAEACLTKALSLHAEQFGRINRFLRSDLTALESLYQACGRPDKARETHTQLQRLPRPAK